MSKAILTLEMPPDCVNCPLSTRILNKLICQYTGLYGTEKERPDWCPLQNMPPDATPDNSDMPIMWNVGWNACLKELEGNSE